jgi:hypothetical protein
MQLQKTSRHHRRLTFWLVSVAALPALPLSSARAQTATPTPPVAQEDITVVATSPLLGSGTDRNLVPADTQVLGSADIARNGNPDVLNALNTEVSGINLDSASGNP